VMLSVVVLAGGQGSRIQPVLGNTPKLLGLINGIPFIVYLLNWLNESLSSIDYEVSLATGIGHEKIQSYIDINSIECTTIREHIPLGTLGAAAHAAEQIDANDTLVINGDTLFECDLKQVYKQFLSAQSRPMAIVKKSLTNDRYGGYIIDKEQGHLLMTGSDSTVISMGALFSTKRSIVTARDNAIQAGITKPMMDKDFIVPNKVYPFILQEDTTFIDIGTPSSYAKAQELIPTKRFSRTN